MARLTTEEKQAAKLQKQIDNQRAMQERARAKQLAKMSDPEWRKEQANKRKAKLDERIAKANSQEERAKREARAKKKLEKQSLSELVANSSYRKKTATGYGKQAEKKKATKGLKGRPPTADESRMADKLGKLPCICCTLLKERGLISADLENDSQFNNVSLHHISGRTRPKAHFKQLPLCGYHHDVTIPKELQTHPEYKYLVPIHEKGSNWGGKVAFNAIFNSEKALLEICYELIGEHDFYVNELS